MTADPGQFSPDRWFLTAAERNNDATALDLRAMRLAEVSHPDDRLLDRPLIKELLAGRRRSFAIERRFMHADGHVFYCAANGVCGEADVQR